MSILSTLLPGLTDLLGKVIDRAIPDPQAANDAKLKVLQLLQTGELAELAAKTDLAKAAADVVKTEAQANSWITRSWRPITMLTFTVLIVARWLGYAAPNLQPEEYLKLWDIVEFGLGGYVIGRSAEKIAPSVVAAISGGKK